MMFYIPLLSKALGIALEYEMCYKNKDALLRLASCPSRALAAAGHDNRGCGQLLI